MSDPHQRQVVSKDGTTIAYEKSGSGPPVILVSAALADRSGTRRLAKELTPHFAVINYDRRGRGGSGDAAPYAVEREVEDIEALIDEAGGSAFLFGSSSGAVLALEAADRLVTKVDKQVLFEPPFIIDDSRAPVTAALRAQAAELVSVDDRTGAVKFFFSKIMGIPLPFVNLMRLMPGWSKMKGLAHTLPYDLAVTADTQRGQPLPAARWPTLKAPTLVITGERSGAFFHRGAEALTDVLPDARHHILKGQGHGAVLMRPKTVAPLLVDFWTGAA